MLCKKSLHDISFPESRASDGRCKLCKHEKDKRYYLKEDARRERRRLRGKQWAIDHPERFRRYQKKHILKKRYNLTLEEYDLLWTNQQGLCYICKKAETAKDVTGATRESLSVDHDHNTGKVRALLCHHCNAALGHVQDSVELLQRMVDYLRGNL